MIRRQVPALTTGSYLLHVPATPDGLLVGFHGYGENCKDHCAQMQRIPEAKNWLICSIQSLHLFYKFPTRDIIGSWMTWQDRELAMENNIHYVRTVVCSLQNEFGLESPLVYCGFSQGVAMAYRAATRSGVPCSGVIALAGDVPPEIAADRRLPIPPVLLGRGLEDPWYTEEKMELDLKSLHGRATVTPCIFEGGHDWSPEFIEAGSRFLAAMRVSKEQETTP